MGAGTLARVWHRQQIGIRMLTLAKLSDLHRLLGSSSSLLVVARAVRPLKTVH